jgi:hypothetical protein
MPEKPTWYGRLDEIIAALNSLPYPWVDSQTVEKLLGVGRRRAQQVLRPCVAQQVGLNGIAGRDDLIAHLRRLAAGDAAYYEKQRQLKLARVLTELHKAWTAQPRVPVAAPQSVVNRDFADLPPGVALNPGRIAVTFETPEEALQKLLALAMAIGNDFERFRTAVQTRSRE